MKRIIIGVLLLLTLFQAGCYYGALDPQADIPERCFLTPGLECVDHKVQSSHAQMVLLNGIGYDITITGITLTAPELDFGCDLTGEQVILHLGERQSFSVPCRGDITTGKRYRFDVKVKYASSVDTLPHTIDGELTATIS